jgi:hypothetical protein
VQNLLCASRIAQLEQEVQHLGNERKRLMLKQDILLGLCVAAGLAAHTLGQSLQERDRRAAESGTAAIPYPGLWELELTRYDHEIELVLHDSPDVASLLANSLPQLPPPLPGCSRGLFSRFLKDESSTSCASVLDGGPMSLLVACSVCLISDANISSTVNKYSNQEDVYNQHCSMQPPLKLLLLRYDAAQDLASQMKIIRDIATVFPATWSLDLGTRLLKHELMYEGDRGRVNFPPEALLDVLTGEVDLGREQLQGIITGLEVFHELQEPFAKKAAAISQGMAKLLQKHRPFCPPSSACLGTAQAWHAPGRPSEELAGAGQGAGASPLAVKACDDFVDGIEGKMASLGLCDHEALSSMADQLAKVNAKTALMDAWSMSFIIGQLSWVQVRSGFC